MVNLTTSGIPQSVESMEPHEVFMEDEAEEMRHPAIIMHQGKFKLTLDMKEDSNSKKNRYAAREAIHRMLNPAVVISQPPTPPPAITKADYARAVALGRTIPQRLMTISL